jgi:hypothetical protein
MNKSTAGLLSCLALVLVTIVVCLPAHPGKRPPDDEAPEHKRKASMSHHQLFENSRATHPLPSSVLDWGRPEVNGGVRLVAGSRCDLSITITLLKDVPKNWRLEA